MSDDLFDDFELRDGWLPDRAGMAAVNNLRRQLAEEREKSEKLTDNVIVLARVGRMYLDALDADPTNEWLTLPEAIMVTQVRDAVVAVEARQSGAGQ